MLKQAWASPVPAHARAGERGQADPWIARNVGALAAALETVRDQDEDG